MAEGIEQSQAVLLAVGELLGKEIALDDLLQMLMDRIIDSMHADRGTLYLLDPARKELFSKAAHLPELEEIRLEVGQGIAGMVAQTGKPVNAGSASRELHFFRDIDRRTGYQSRSVLAVPIRDHRDQIIGVIQLLNKKGGAFNRCDEQMLLDLAKQTALALEATSLYEELRRAETDPVSAVSYQYNNIIGESEVMQAVYRATRKAASTRATVLIRGESGTGKELIARAIQVNGPRRDKPFIKVDCAALPGSLIENELFGHERGAFTGATHRAIGKFEAAHLGTIFIDEIGELPLSVQGKLLRVLQDRQFERVGGTDTVDVDLRIVSATNRNLEKLVREGRFRADLYYRIRVLEIALPPLRARGKEDVRRLVKHFAVATARRYAQEVPELSRDAWERLFRYPWPGNVRELEHCIESAVILCEGSVLTGAHLPLPWHAPLLPGVEPGSPQQSLESASSVSPAPLESGHPHVMDWHEDSSTDQSWPVSPGPGPAGSSDEDLSLAAVERRHIMKVLRLSENNRSRAARLLRIGRNTLSRKLKGFGA